MQEVVVSRVIGGKEYTFKTGKMARQATGSILASCGETMVLVTFVCSKDARPEAGFFPLVVDFLEKTYAAGKFPGGFFK